MSAVPASAFLPAVTIACGRPPSRAEAIIAGGMRVLAIDVGERRVGLAISDPTRTLARPLATLTVDPGRAVDTVAHKIAQLAGEDDGVAEIVVGMPVHLDGSPSEQTTRVAAFVAAL